MKTMGRLTYDIYNNIIRQIYKQEDELQLPKLFQNVMNGDIVLKTFVLYISSFFVGTC